MPDETPLDAIGAPLVRDGEVVVEFDLAIHPESVILAATHRLTDRAHVRIEPGALGRWRCSLRAKQAMTSLQYLAGELGNAVLDELLRERIRRETAPIRAVLIAQAFSKTNLLRPELDDAESSADPNHIGRPDRHAPSS